jgi:glycosyltransferase involved in cell wall biosynthesis
MKTITVGIPSYNQEAYLAEAIESVIAQGVAPDEFIIVDDGSTDKSLALARHYPTKVVSQVNKGLASARNAIIMNATSDYVFFLDADDIMTEDCLKVIKSAIAESDADIIAPSLKCFGKAEDTIIISPTVTLDLFKNFQNFLPYCCAVKREKLLEVGGYSPRMEQGWEDLHLWVTLLSRGATVKTIQKPLVLYRTKEESMYTRSILYALELKTQLKKDFPSVFI